MIENSDLIEISRRKELASFYVENYQKFEALGKLSKASEFLYGAFNEIIYAIGILNNNKLSDHGKIRIFMVDLANKYNDSKLFDSFKKMESLHANFFHDFLDKDGFSVFSKEAMQFLERLDTILKLEINAK